ncbi:LCP family protein [Limosilactobacillus caecicola]|uniref:LCP family protein n=1 Tax=Limosilactobacillus caecicola TaxID=2941332 RepID=UPI003898FEF0
MLHQVSELLGVPINNYALVNMGTLKKVVNIVGGVRVNNPFAFTYEGYHFKKGWQHWNGNEALKYSRMRYDDPNNDYGRQKRGQQVIESVIRTFKKNWSVKSANQLIAAMQDGVRTDVPLKNSATLYLNYHQAMERVTKDYLQGKNA